MKTKVVNVRKEPYDVYIGRPGSKPSSAFGLPVMKFRLGNPFPVRIYGREVCLEKYREFFYRTLESNPEFKAFIHSLKGKTLGCFCKPSNCHGDIIADYLNNLEATENATQ